MDIKSMPQMSAVNIAILLIGVGVFYNFVISPIYTKYQLNNCLQKVDTNYISAKEEYCEAIKPSNHQTSIPVCMKHRVKSIAQIP